jgi:tetratricopeptide (TPR) repeat protein
MRLGVTVVSSAQSPPTITGLLFAALLSLVLIATAAAQNLPSPTQVSLQIIVVPSASEAQQLLERLNKGEDFATLAKQKSNDATADDGGYMGKMAPAALRPELRSALTSLAPGKISGIIKLPSGYAILKLLPEGISPAPTNSNPARILPLAATGSIRYPPSVGGKGEADLAFRYFPKPENWSQDLRGLCTIRKQSLSSAVEQLEKDSSLMSSDAALKGSPLDQIERHYALANLYAYQGIMNKSVAEWETAYQIATAQLPGAMPELEEVLGIAYLHKSEMDNNVYSSPGDRCIFPPQSGVRYQEIGASQKSIEYLSKYLELKPDAYDMRWLLNLAYMTIGKYPDGVPKKYLVPPSAFMSTEEVGRFVDVAPVAGINLFSESGGLIVDDFDGDGLLDVVTSDYDQCAAMHFFHNNGNGTFTDRTAQAGLADQLGGLNLLQADYNNDGCTDILVLRGAWEFPQRKSLLRNNCDGTFTDVTVASGLAEPATSTQTAVWADIDNDGLLDLLVGNEKGPAQLFHNKGDGTFEDISHSAGVDEIAFTKGVTAADYDNDGYVDFYLSNLNGNNFLYHNNHDRTFTEVAQKAGVQKPWQSFATWFFDYDNDGLPDLFVTSYYISVDESIRTYLALPLNAETLKLYKNLGDGTFRDVTTEVGLDKVFMPMGSNFGDIDNDGYLDLYLGTGNPTYGSLLPNVLLRNKEGKSFVDVTASSGTGELHKGHGVAFADIDNDGDEDLLTEIGGAVPGDRHAFRLFENPGNGNDWITLHLIGVKTNRSAIGARIKLTVENEGHGTRSIYRTVGSGGSFGASPLQQHIGLGKSARLVDVEIWWPTSNTRQHFPDVQKDQFLEIKEFAKNYVRLERPRYRLGGATKDTVASPKQPPSTDARK